MYLGCQIMSNSGLLKGIFIEVLLEYDAVVIAMLVTLPIVSDVILATFSPPEPTMLIDREESVFDSGNQSNDCWVNLEVYPFVVRKSYMLPNTRNLYFYIKIKRLT